MTPARISRKIVGDRTDWIRRMLAGIRELPLDSFEAFAADARNVAAADSYLRRSLEALLDLGRHFLAKGFGRAAAEYKEIADGLGKVGVLGPEDVRLLRDLAGYRNRLVHYYAAITDRELYDICVGQLGDVERIVNVLQRWLDDHPERVDDSL